MIESKKSSCHQIKPIKIKILALNVQSKNSKLNNLFFVSLSDNNQLYCA